MHICFVLPEFNCSEFGKSGGVGHISAVLADQYIKKSHEVSVIVGTWDNKKSIDFTLTNGVNVYLFYKYKPLFLLNIFMRICKKLKFKKLTHFLQNILEFSSRKNYLHQIYKVDRINPIDIIETSDSYGCMANYDGVIPYITRLHSSYTLLSNVSKRKGYEHYKEYEYQSLCNASYYIGVSKTVLNDSEKVFNCSLLPQKVIYNGISDIFFQQANKTVLSSKNTIKLIYIGNISLHKGMPVICEIVNKLDLLRIDFKLDLYGSGQNDWYKIYLPAINETARNNISYHGHVSTEHVARILNKSDILLCPSSYESFGLTVAEAQAAGIPVIINNYDASYEIVENNETGYICNINYIDKWIEYIIELLKNNKLYQKMSSSAYNNAFDKFNIEKMTNESLFIYKEVLTLNCKNKDEI